MKTSGLCSWQNYQEYLSTVTTVKDIMQEYYNKPEMDLLDAHSFLWIVAQFHGNIGGEPHIEFDIEKVKIGTSVFHKEYRKGTITKISDRNIYIDFDIGVKLIFPNPEAFTKRWLRLV